MKWRAVLVLPAVAALACGGDPEARKRQFVAEGDRYMAEEKYAEAVVQYRNAVKDDARFGEGRFKLAEAFAAAGDPRNAVLEAVRAADLLQEDADAQLRAGTFLLLARQYPEARQRAMAVLAKDPKNARAMVLLGNALAGLKDLDGAIEQVEQAVGEDPLLTLTYSNLGALQLAKGDRDAAEATFKRAVSTVPDSADARLSLANFYWAVGRREEAEVELVAALKIDPKSAIGNRALGAFYLSQNRLAEAEPYLKAYADITGNTDARLVLSDYYVRSGKSAEAAKILNPLVREREGRFPAIVRLAALDFGAGRRDEAYARIDQILKEQPEAVRALQAKTEFLLLEGKAKEALAASSALVEADARGSRSRYLRGLALEAAGKTPDALATFRDLLTSMPSSVAVQSKLAEVSMRQGRSKEALSLALQVVKARPRSVAAHFLYAQALVGVGDLPNAERELLAVQKVIPQSADVHTWLGILYDRKQDLISSRRAYEQALELSPDDRRALAGLVGVDLQEKKPATALARIESRIPGAPDDITLAGIKGRAALEAGDLAKAEDAYRRVLELDENNIEAYGRLSSIYWAQNRLDEAKKSLEALARQQSKPVAAETLIGMILVRQNKPDEARKHFERALDINSRAAVAANSLAWDYANTGGNLDVALQLAQAAKAQLPTVGEITDTLGWIYYKKGLSSLAVSTFREAVQQSPTNPRIHYRLGLAHLQNGDKVSAKSALQQALKLNLDAENATEARRVLNTL